jgi:hypothetical protein
MFEVGQSIPPDTAHVSLIRPQDLLFALLWIAAYTGKMILSLTVLFLLPPLPFGLTLVTSYTVKRSLL